MGLPLLSRLIVVRRHRERPWRLLTAEQQFDRLRDRH
jgi:hypothetical protein